MCPEFIAVVGAIATVLAGFGGAALGACFAYRAGMKLVQKTHKNAIDLMQRQEFNKAAAEFRVAFIEEQRLLDPHSLADRVGHSVTDIIKAAIDRHETAMIRFEPFVCKSEIEEYKKAWKDYAGDSRHCEQYSGRTAIEKEKRRTLARERINNLLKFAEPKH